MRFVCRVCHREFTEDKIVMKSFMEALVLYCESCYEKRKILYEGNIGWIVKGENEPKTSNKFEDTSDQPVKKGWFGGRK